MKAISALTKSSLHHSLPHHLSKKHLPSVKVCVRWASHTPLSVVHSPLSPCCLTGDYPLLQAQVSIGTWWLGGRPAWAQSGPMEHWWNRHLQEIPLECIHLINTAGTSNNILLKCSFTCILSDKWHWRFYRLKIIDNINSVPSVALACLFCSLLNIYACCDELCGQKYNFFLVDWMIWRSIMKKIYLMHK